MIRIPHVFLIALFLLASVTSFAQKDSIKVIKTMDKAVAMEVSQPDEAIKVYQEAFHMSVKIGWDKGASKAMMGIGFVHSDNGRYDQSIVFYQKAMPYAKKADYKRGIAGAYVNTGNSYQYKGDYQKAIDLYLKGVPIMETVGDSTAVSICYQNLSALYATIKNLPLEELYQKKALQFVKSSAAEQKGIIYCDMVLMYIRQNKFSEAMLYLRKAEEIATTNPSETLAFFTQRNFGEYYNHSKQYSKAIPYYEKALVLTKKLNDAFQKNDLLYVLSGLYINIGNYPKALQYGLESLELAQKNNSKEIIYRSQKRLSIIYNKLNQPQKAFDLLEKSYTLKDTFLTESHIKQMTMMQTQFETEKKDKAIAQQQIKLNKNEVELLQKERQRILSLIIISLLVVFSLGIWLFYRQRQRIKNKEIIELKQQQEIAQLEALIDGEEKERRRIAQELHDGINGDLSAIKFRLSALEDAIPDHDERETLKKTIEMIDNSCAQVRSISHNLMPASIVDFGLVETIRQFCAKIDSSHPIEIDFQYFGNPAVLPQNVETVIFRIIQELLQNIIKHAEATSAMVQLNFHDDELSITVEDNGKGFDNEKAQEGLGLKNIRSRVDFLNAQLDLTSNQSGTSFHITIDLNSL